MSVQPHLHNCLRKREVKKQLRVARPSFREGAGIVPVGPPSFSGQRRKKKKKKQKKKKKKKRRHRRGDKRCALLASTQGCFILAPVHKKPSIVSGDLILIFVELPLVRALVLPFVRLEATAASE